MVRLLIFARRPLFLGLEGCFRVLTKALGGPVGDERLVGLSTANSGAVACIHIGLSKWGATSSCPANPAEEQGEQESPNPQARACWITLTLNVSVRLGLEGRGLRPRWEVRFDEQSLRTPHLF